MSAEVKLNTQKHVTVPSEARPMNPSRSHQLTTHSIWGGQWNDSVFFLLLARAALCTETIRVLKFRAPPLTRNLTGFHSPSRQKRQEDHFTVIHTDSKRYKHKIKFCRKFKKSPGSKMVLRFSNCGTCTISGTTNQNNWKQIFTNKNVFN